MDKIKEIFANLPAVTGGSYLRLLALIVTLTALALKSAGVEVLPAESGDAGTAVTISAAALSALAAYWKNNSFTSAAIAADEVMKKLKV